MTRVELAQACIDKYGAEKQKLKMVEEMAELTQRVCQFQNGRFVQDQVAEEIADCLAVLDGMDILFGVAENHEDTYTGFTGYKILLITIGNIQFWLPRDHGVGWEKQTMGSLFYLLRLELMGLSKEIGQDKVDTWRQIKADRMEERLKI